MEKGRSSGPWAKGIFFGCVSREEPPSTGHSIFTSLDSFFPSPAVNRHRGDQSWCELCTHSIELLVLLLFSSSFKMTGLQRDAQGSTRSNSGFCNWATVAVRTKEEHLSLRLLRCVVSGLVVKLTRTVLACTSDFIFKELPPVASWATLLILGLPEPRQFK